MAGNAKSDRERWEEDVVKVDGQQIEEAFGAGGGHRVARVVGVRPGVCTGGEAAVSQQVEDALQRPDAQ